MKGVAREFLKPETGVLPAKGNIGKALKKALNKHNKQAMVKKSKSFGFGKK